MLQVSLITLGDPQRLTGGYLYHRRMAAAAADQDASVGFGSCPDLVFPVGVVPARGVLRRALDADVIVVDSIVAAVLAPWIRSERARPPVVGMLHQPPGGIEHGPVRSRVQARLDKHTYRRARLLIVASETLAVDLRTHGFPADVVRLVPPGRDPAPSTGPLPDLRAGRRAAFLCVGNWVPRKGIIDLLEAFARLPPESATLHLVGDDRAEPGYAARVRARLAEPALVERVIVHGPRPAGEVAALYEAADAFVLPSTKEPYGTVYGEALAAGLPVVGWAAGNLPHLAADGREGVVLPPGDIEGLSAALLRLADDDAYRRHLADAARRRGALLPSWDDTARAFFAALREVAGAGPR
jgi:glycosyltransferase involved in cell wall biosynthesis